MEGASAKCSALAGMDFNSGIDRPVVLPNLPRVQGRGAYAGRRQPLRGKFFNHEIL